MIGDILISILGIFLGIFGIIGSIIPAIPGPPISWIGMMVMYLHFDDEISTASLFIWLGITIAVTIFDFIVPGKITRLTGGGKAANWGATIGMLIGMGFTPIGMIIGALLGAFIAELLWGSKNGADSVNASLGAFLGFLLGTGVKLVVSIWMLGIIISSVF